MFNKFFTRKKYVHLCIFLVVIVIFVSCGRFYQLKRAAEQKKVVEIAQEYLNDRYKQKMVFIKYSHWEGYNVYFALANRPDLKFNVRILNYSKLFHEDYRVMYDDYYAVYFMNLIHEFYLPYAQEIWGEKVRIIGSANFFSDKDYKGSLPLHENISLEEAEVKKFLNKNYSLSVEIPYYFDETAKKAEAEKILDFIFTTQESGFLPDDIMFIRYPNKQDLESGNKYEKIEAIWIYDLSSINEIDQILAYIDKDWFYTENSGPEIARSS